MHAAGVEAWHATRPQAVNGGAPTYFGAPLPFSLETLLAVEFVAMAGAESYRGAQEDPEKRKYPGGAFDPMGVYNDEHFKCSPCLCCCCRFQCAWSVLRRLEVGFTANFLCRSNLFDVPLQVCQRATWTS